MAARKSPPKAKKASGANVEEWQRKTFKVQLRLPPDVADLLHEKALNEEVGVSEYVTRLMRAMLDNPAVPCGAILDDVRGPYGDFG